jgi:transcription elongation factor GreB
MILMSDQQKNYITPQGFQKLKDEYSKLLNEERPRIVETVAWAASNGDRSENADYHYGKKRLREIDSRLRFLMRRIENAEVVDPKLIKPSGKVLFGATVTILNEEDERVTYQIVGEDEFDVKSGKISWKSPLARALLGKKLDEDVPVKKPNGEEIVTIVEIQFL